MLFYALVNRKYNSANKILEYIRKANLKSLKVGRNDMRPIAACIISPDIEFFRRLMDREVTKDVDSITIEDLRLTKRMYSFVHYLCKKHRMTKGRNEDIK